MPGSPGGYSIRTRLLPEGRGRVEQLAAVADTRRRARPISPRTTRRPFRHHTPPRLPSHGMTQQNTLIVSRTVTGEEVMHQWQSSPNLFALTDESVDERGITHRRSTLVTDCVFQGGSDIPRGTMVTFADGSQRLVESTEDAAEGMPAVASRRRSILPLLHVNTFVRSVAPQMDSPPPSSRKMLRFNRIRRDSARSAAECRSSAWVGSIRRRTSTGCAARSRGRRTQHRVGVSA